MNALAFDLNLIPVLDALLREQHVTRAGEALQQSQSTTSAALARLRTLLDDQILERQGNQMRLTPRASELREPVAAALAAIERVLRGVGQFDPSTSHTIRISAPSNVVAIIIPALIELLVRAEAKSVSFVRRSAECCSGWTTAPLTSGWASSRTCHPAFVASCCTKRPTSQ